MGRSWGLEYFQEGIKTAISAIAASSVCQHDTEARGGHMHYLHARSQHVREGGGSMLGGRLRRRRWAAVAAFAGAAVMIGSAPAALAATG